MKLRDLSPENRRWGISVAIVFATGLLLGVGVNAADAGTAYSSDGYYTVAGHQYVNRAIINTGPSIVVAITNTSWSSGSTPTGWAGARGRLFTSGGSLSCEGSNIYNSSAGSLAVGYSCNRFTSAAWYGYGVSLAWNGGGYTSFYTFKSPNQNS